MWRVASEVSGSMRVQIRLVTLFLVFFGAERAAAQVEVALRVPQLDLEACLAPQTIEEWRASGTTLGAEALREGETMCSVLRRGGVPAEILKMIDERASAPFEM